MYIYDLIIGNKELLKIFYALIIGVVCIIIVIKTDRLFRLSLHQGIRYFRNAFFFYGIGFMVRYIFGAGLFFGYIDKNYYILIKFLFEYFLILGGFFLLYSLLWKRIESPEEKYTSSLLNAKSFLFYFMALIIAILDYLWQTYYFMFFSQIILFCYASIISCKNYRKKGKQRRFLKFYFIAMMLSLIAWILNAIAALYLNWYKGVLINVYILNIIIFLLFLYGVVKITKTK